MKVKGSNNHIPYTRVSNCEILSFESQMPTCQHALEFQPGFNPFFPLFFVCFLYPFWIRAPKISGPGPCGNPDTTKVYCISNSISDWLIVWHFVFWRSKWRCEWKGYSHIYLSHGSNGSWVIGKSYILVYAAFMTHLFTPILDQFSPKKLKSSPNRLKSSRLAQNYVKVAQNYLKSAQMSSN